MTNFVFTTNPTLTLVSIPAGAPARYSIDTAAHLTGMHPDLVRYYCRIGLLGAGRTGTGEDPVLDDEALYGLRSIERYRRAHGVNRRALPLLWALEQEVERLQAELRFLRKF
jgi:DNA-binding transcriptional MerR regulator